MLSDDRSIEVYRHCTDILKSKQHELHIKQVYSFPIVYKDSCLLWCPVIRGVSLSPINENEPCEFTDMNRPLFYYELDAGRWYEMKRRYRLSKKKKKRGLLAEFPKPKPETLHDNDNE